jgi:hypothetical protein
MSLREQEDKMAAGRNRAIGAGHVGAVLVVLVGMVTLMVGCSTDRTGAGGRVDSSGGEEETRALWHGIVGDARWAQNAHNVQSLRLSLSNDGTIVGGLDSSRLLPETDPIGRQLVLSLGAFTEAARQSARLRGHELTAAWIAPADWSIGDGPDADLFTWSLSPLASGDTDSGEPPLDGLTSATVKFGLKPATVDAAFAGAIESNWSTADARIVVESDTSRVRDTIDLAIESFEIEMRHEPTLMESYDYTRIGRRERREQPWGLSLVANFPSRSLWLIDPVTTLFRQSPGQFADSGIGLFNDTVIDGESLVVLTTPDNTPARWFAAGQPLQAAWMEMRAEGFELLPLSQGLQEYPEVARQYDRFHELWAAPGETVQMIMLVGTPRARFSRSPRLPASAFFDR